MTMDAHRQRRAAVDGRPDREGVRDLHPHHPRAPVGGDHRPAAAPPLQLRAGGPLRLEGGLEYELSDPQAGRMAIGENLEVDPPRRLVQSFTALWSEEVQREGRSRVTWEIEPVGDSCRLTVTHDQSARGRPRRDLRRLAADPVRAEDAAGDRRGPDHAGLAALHGRERLAAGRAWRRRGRWARPQPRGRSATIAEQ